MYAVMPAGAMTMSPAIRCLRNDRAARPSAIVLELAHDLLLEAPHLALQSLVALRMLMSQDVQHAVHSQPHELLFGLNAESVSLPQRLLETNVDIAQGRITVI